MKFIIQMTPDEYEKRALSEIQKAAPAFSDIKIVHQERIIAHDGTYKLDGTVSFKMFFGIDIKIVVECKQHSNPVERADVQVLHDKISSLGAHKGILFSTAGFQSGAIQYARTHGIALIYMADGATDAIVCSADPPPLIDQPEYVAWWIEANEAGSTLLTRCNGAANPIVGWLRNQNEENTGKSP